MDEIKVDVFHPSSLGPLQVCPRFKNDENRDSTFADKGTELHGMVATGEGDLETLTEEEKAAVLCCREYLKNLKNKLIEEFTLETEVSMTGKINKKAGLIGMMDVLILDAPVHYAHVIDWKFGQGAVLPADRNPQIMSYALMVFQKYQTLAQVTTTLVCPLQEGEDVKSEHIWDRADVPVIQEFLEAIVTRVQDEQQGPILNWAVCRYCGGKATCPQMCQVMTRSSEVVMPETVLELLSFQNLSPDVRGKWQQVAEWAEDWAKQVKRTNKDAALLDDEEVEGYKIVRRKGTSKVDNTALAIEMLVSMGYARNILMAACTLSLPTLSKGLEALPEEERGGGKKSEIREKLNALLENNLREGEPVVYLKRTKVKKVKEIK